MNKIVAALAILICNPSHAQYLDPQNLLPQMRDFLGQHALEEAFTCGDSAALDVFRISCKFNPVENGIEGECADVADPKGIRIQRSVYNCQPDSVSFLIDLTGDSTDLTRSDFDLAHGNVAEVFLARISQFIGYPNSIATIQSVEAASYNLGRESGHPWQVPALSIGGRVGEPGQASFSFLITVIKDAAGVAQLARYRMDDITWFRVDGFTPAPRRMQ